MDLEVQVHNRYRISIAEVPYKFFCWNINKIDSKGDILVACGCERSMDKAIKKSKQKYDYIMQHEKEIEKIFNYKITISTEPEMLNGLLQYSWKVELLDKFGKVPVRTIANGYESSLKSSFNKVTSVLNQIYSTLNVL